MNAIYQTTMNPTLWVMAKMSRKIKSFRLDPKVAAVIEQTASQLGKSESQIIDLCVVRQIAEVVQEEMKSSSMLVDEEALSSFSEALKAWKASQDAPPNKLSLGKSRKGRGKG